MQINLNLAEMPGFLLHSSPPLLHLQYLKSFSIFKIDKPFK